MADQGDILNVLNPHHAEQLAALFIAPKPHAAFNFMAKLFPRHVRLMPAVSRNHATVGFSGLVDDGKDGVEVGVGAGADHGKTSMDHSSFSAIRAFTSLRTRAAGRGLSAWKRMVPLLVLYSLSSSLNASTVEELMG